MNAINNENNTPTELNAGQKTAGALEKRFLEKTDLDVTGKWVREELFQRVKFLYNPAKELQVGGSIYQFFLRQCEPRFRGTLKCRQSATTTEKEEAKRHNDMYCQMIWMEATKKKRNIVCEGLNSRRSSVYTSLNNRFVGKYKVWFEYTICEAKQVVLCLPADL